MSEATTNEITNETTNETAASETAEPAGRGGRFYQTLDPAEPIPDPYSLPIEDINMVYPRLFQEDAIWPYFERLRREAPVYHHEESIVGPYWSVTKMEDIKYVDSHHEIFSSQQQKGGIALGGVPDRQSAHWSDTSGIPLTPSMTSWRGAPL